jgi:hypothetical protein
VVAVPLLTALSADADGGPFSLNGGNPGIAGADPGIIGPSFGIAGADPRLRGGDPVIRSQGQGGVAGGDAALFLFRRP